MVQDFCPSLKTVIDANRTTRIAGIILYSKEGALESNICVLLYSHATSRTNPVI